MFVFPNGRLLMTIGALVLFLGTSLRAAPPAASVLPIATRGHLASSDLDRLETNWKNTQIGRLMADPVMKPFADDLQRQVRDKWSRAYERVVLDLDDVRAMASGEASLSLIHEAGARPVLAVTVDITGNEQAAAERLEAVYERLAKEQARRRPPVELGGVTLTVFDRAPAPDGEERRRQSVYFTKDDLFVAVDDLATAEEMLGRFGNAAAESLARLPAYEAVMRRSGAEDDAAADFRWFAEPIALVEAMRASDASIKRQGRDMLKVLKNQGFDGVQGMGGAVQFGAAEGQFEILHRTAVFAPRPWKLAMRMLEFPNAADFAPQPWAPRDLATYATFYTDVQNAFEMSASMFDELVGGGKEGVFESTLESIRTDPNGPRVDIRNDLIEQLGTRVTLMTDYRLPITTSSERRLFALETTNEPTLAATIRKIMISDRSAKKTEFEGHVIWEISEEADDTPEVNVGSSLPRVGGNAATPSAPVEEPEGRLLAQSAVAVAKGHLFVASHVDILKRVLHEIGEHDALVRDIDFQIVMAELEDLAPAENCARVFTRTDEQYRGTYELIRAGKMPEADTMLAKVLNSALGSGVKGEVRKPRIDGGQLPDFDAIRRYFGPAGTAVTSVEDGWSVVGFTLNKQMPVGVAAQ